MKINVLNVIRPTENYGFAVYDINGVKLPIRLSLNFRHLNTHNFWPNVKDMTDSMWSYDVNQRQYFGTDFATIFTLHKA